MHPLAQHLYFEEFVVRKPIELCVYEDLLVLEHLYARHLGNASKRQDLCHLELPFLSSNMHLAIEFLKCSYLKLFVIEELKYLNTLTLLHVASVPD
jgi:hypothetical protein